MLKTKFIIFFGLIHLSSPFLYASHTSDEELAKECSRPKPKASEYGFSDYLPGTQSSELINIDAEIRDEIAEQPYWTKKGQKYEELARENKRKFEEYLTKLAEWRSFCANERREKLKEEISEGKKKIEELEKLQREDFKHNRDLQERLDAQEIARRNQKQDISEDREHQRDNRDHERKIQIEDRHYDTERERENQKHQDEKEKLERAAERGKENREMFTSAVATMSEPLIKSFDKLAHKTVDELAPIFSKELSNYLDGSNELTHSTYIEDIASKIVLNKEYSGLEEKFKMLIAASNLTERRKIEALFEFEQAIHALRVAQQDYPNSFNSIQSIATCAKGIHGLCMAASQVTKPILALGAMVSGGVAHMLGSRDRYRALIQAQEVLAQCPSTGEATNNFLKMFVNYYGKDYYLPVIRLSDNWGSSVGDFVGGAICNANTAANLAWNTSTGVLDSANGLIKHYPNATLAGTAIVIAVASSACTDYFLTKYGDELSLFSRRRAMTEKDKAKYKNIVENVRPKEVANLETNHNDSNDSDYKLDNDSLHDEPRRQPIQSQRSHASSSSQPKKYSVQTSSPSNVRSSQTSDRKIEDFRKIYNRYKVINIEPNGNCGFEAIARGLNTLPRFQMKHYNQSQIRQALTRSRQLFTISELYGNSELNNPELMDDEHTYAPLMGGMDGYWFGSSEADVQRMANYFGVIIEIFDTNSYNHTFYIPHNMEQLENLDDHVIRLSYSHDGSGKTGHYDLLLEKRSNQVHFSEDLDSKSDEDESDHQAESGLLSDSDG